MLSDSGTQWNAARMAGAMPELSLTTSFSPSSGDMPISCHNHLPSHSQSLSYSSPFTWFWDFSEIMPSAMSSDQLLITMPLSAGVFESTKSL